MITPRLLALLSGGSPPAPEDVALTEQGLVRASRRGTTVLTEAGEKVLYQHAARQVNEALHAWEGRRLSLDRWRKTVGEALGLGRVADDRFYAVLAAGAELKLFSVDNGSGSYPFLVPMSKTAWPKVGAREGVVDLRQGRPQPAGAMEPVPPSEDTAEAEDEPERPAPTPTEGPVDAPPPYDGEPLVNPPTFRACGHLDFWGEALHAVAVEEGLCCEGARHKMQIHYDQRRGDYASIVVPTSARRHKLRTDGGGYCCDDQGLYIGGVFNDCRRGRKRCAFHRK